MTYDEAKKVMEESVRPQLMQFAALLSEFKDQAIKTGGYLQRGVGSPPPEKMAAKLNKAQEKVLAYVTTLLIQNALAKPNEPQEPPSPEGG